MADKCHYKANYYMAAKNGTNKIEVDLGVALNEIKNLRDDVKNLTDKIEGNYITKFAFDPLAHRVSKLEDAQTWLVRLIIGLVIAAILGVILSVK